MPAPDRNAVSYDRCSSTRQGEEDRDSLTRQAQAYHAFCEHHQLTAAKEGYVDKGLSGFTGKHRKKGALRRLIVAAEQGAFPAGTVIVVEAWDRLGRLRPDKQTELIAKLLRTGVSIGICRLNDIFTEEDFGTHKWTTLAVFIQLAYQESKQKSDRIRGAKHRNNERARQGKLPIITHHLPAWVADEGGRLVPVAERVDVVRRMFELALAGLGYGAIARRLHTEGVEPFKGKRWCRSYVRFILTDRRVLGEHQPTTTKVKKGKDDKAVVDANGDEVHETVPDGGVIAGYYPGVVGEETFHDAQTGRDGRTQRKGKSNVWTAEEDAIIQAEGAAVAYKRLRARGCKRTHTAVYQRKRKLARQATPTPAKTHRHATVNVFARLLKNARDGNGYTTTNRRDSGVPVPTLVNGGCQDGKGTGLLSFPYATFEAAVLSKLAEIAPSELVGEKPEQGDEVTPIRDERDRQRVKVKTLEAIQNEVPSLANGRVLRQAEERLQGLEKEVRAAEQRAAHPVEVEWQSFRNLYEALAAAEDPVAARLKVRAVLRNAVDAVHLLVVRKGAGRLAAVQVDFREGSRRSYLVRHQPPKGNRHGRGLEAGYWQVRSWTRTEAETFDLGTREGAADAEVYLKAETRPDGNAPFALALAFGGCPKNPLP